MTPLLSLQHIKKSYRDRTVLHDLNLTIEAGQIVGLLGPNGAGKTTAFYIAMGLIQPDAGTILFQGQTITSLPIHERARMGMGYLAQEPSIFRGMSVEENITCILETLPLTAAERADQLELLLDELHLKHLRRSQAVYLSGGERRRLEITRCLATSPKLLLLDEPFANVDPITVSDMKEMILHLKNKGISILITDHNAQEIFSIADISFIVMEGKILKSGTAEALVLDPTVRSRYLGQRFSLQPEKSS